MNQTEQLQRGRKWLTFILYFLGLILLFEWLLPLNSIVTFDYFHLFIIYAVFSFFVTYLKIPTWLSFLLKIIGLLFLIQYAFLPESILSDIWKNTVQLEWQINSHAFIERNWYLFTDLFQTLLFLLIIALVSYILYFWLITMKRVFIFIALTFVFVTVMDTFTNYQADQAIIRLIVVGVLMLVVNNYLKKAGQKQLPIAFFEWFRRILVPLMFIMVGIGLVSYFVPKSEPIWPDPVPFLTEVATDFSFGGFGETRQVGYGEDDSRLGGSFQMDDSPVFHAETPLDHYWRIESKDYYTGHGWQRQPAVDFQEFFEGSFQLMTSNLNEPLREATIEYTEHLNFNKLVYPYGVYSANSENIDYFIFDQETGQIEPEYTEEDVSIAPVDDLQSAPIEITYQYPDISTDRLQQADGPVPHEIAETYLQLPNQMPERVVELAEDIVDDEQTLYDAATAIESYFDQGDYIYQLNDIPIPDEGDDFVDQFLFETQAGYCDHFSTSMVVMLRAVGIPARWVKGFTSGEQIEDLSTDDEELYRYEITNSNAHSWVEVYFSGIGWVPFEPTIGFSGNEIIYEETDEPIEEEEEEDQEEEQDERVEEETEQEEPEEKTPSITANETEKQNSRAWFPELNLWPWLLSLLAILIIFVLVKWKAILQRIILWRWPQFEDETDFQKAYRGLMLLLKMYQLKRSPIQTLHDFAKEVDCHFENKLMKPLTDEYAKIIYQKSYQLNNKELLHKQYHALIERILT